MRISWQTRWDIRRFSGRATAIPSPARRAGRASAGWSTSGTLPGNEARTVHVTYAEQECGDYRVVLVLPDDTVVELEEGENTVEVPEGSTWMAVAAAGGGGAFTAQWES